MKNINKKYLMFGVLGIFAVALVSAGLLTYYGVLTWDVKVEQAVVVSGLPIVFDKFAIAGDSFTDCGDGTDEFSVKNNANIEAPIEFQLTQCKIGEGNCNTSGYDEEGITTVVYGVLELTTKSGEWVATNGKKAIVEYSIVGDVFNYEIIWGEGDLDVNGYKLIYYKDVEGDQCTNENTPLKNRAPGIVYVINENIGSLPYAEDFNVKETANYCGNCYGDTYTHCKGAKLWLVPSANAVDGLINWNGSQNFLYETDLITYTKTTDNIITLPSKGGFDFCVDNDFALDLEAGDYKITTSVIPA